MWQEIGDSCGLLVGTYVEPWRFLLILDTKLLQLGQMATALAMLLVKDKAKEWREGCDDGDHEENFVKKFSASKERHVKLCWYIYLGNLNEVMGELQLKIGSYLFSG